MIRNILGGFLFEGDDVYKKAGVLSGGERTRLAVARMLLIPSNTLVLDEPTNHLDLDSKDVLLDALEDYGGTLILVSHDRYFVEKLATKIIEIGHGQAAVYPGTYAEFLWSKKMGRRAGPGHAPPPKTSSKAAPAPARNPSRPRRRRQDRARNARGANGRTPNGKRSRGPPKPYRGASQNSKHGSPRASRRSRNWKPPCPRPGSSRTPSRQSPSSSVIRR
jgi:ATP-binding cassette subfamily F protein 3